MDTRKIATEYRMAQWAQILKERKESGEKVKDYCQTRGIGRDRYFYWQRKLREAACNQLVPATREKSLAPAGFAEVHVEPTSWGDGGNSQTGSLYAEAAGVRLNADSAYPADKLAYLLRELVRPC